MRKQRRNQKITRPKRSAKQQRSQKKKTKKEETPVVPEKKEYKEERSQKPINLRRNPKLRSKARKSPAKRLPCPAKVRWKRPRNPPTQTKETADL